MLAQKWSGNEDKLYDIKQMVWVCTQTDLDLQTDSLPLVG